MDDVTSGDLFEAFWRTLIYNRTGDDLREKSRPESVIGCSFAYWYMLSKLYFTRKWEKNPYLFDLHLRVLQKLMVPFGRIFDLTYGSRSFFVTESGRIGWAPRTADPGDVVAMFLGNRIPFVAKSVCGGDDWEYAGGCYVHGCMDGETWRIDGVEWKFMRFV